MEKEQRKRPEQELESCVLCRKKTDVSKEMEISLRDCYLEGAGQLCRDCYFELFGNGTEK